VKDLAEVLGLTEAALLRDHRGRQVGFGQQLLGAIELDAGDFVLERPAEEAT
jgi:hypothetical protein